MSKQVLSIEQMKHLKELGVDISRASVSWYRILRTGSDTVVTDWFTVFGTLSICAPTMRYETMPTFTLQDILDILPKYILQDGCTWYAALYIEYENNRIAYGNTDRDGFEIYHEIMIEKDLIDAAYSMLCWCIEQGYIPTDK